MKAHKNEVGMKPQYETRLALLEQSNIHTTETLKRIDSNLIALAQNLSNTVTHLTERMDANFSQLDKKMEYKFEQLDKKIDNINITLNTKIDNNFKYLVTTMITLFVASGLMPAVASLIQKFIH